MNRVNVNGQFDYAVKQHNNELLVNDEAVNADIKQVNAHNWHVINQLKSYNAEVVSFDSVLKTATIKVNNNLYHVTAKDQYDLLLEKMGLSNIANTKISEVKAPMPGMVLKVLAAEGDKIPKGGNLFILEAMKMENIIKSPDDVVVKSIKIKPGDKVEKGQVLVQFS
ncbi:MAG: acetyl-CoA carboxylase biotin carboxyl carrier protein subunit [Mucilaginibacter sp.]